MNLFVLSFFHTPQMVYGVCHAELHFYFSPQFKQLRFHLHVFHVLVDVPIIRFRQKLQFF